VPAPEETPERPNPDAFAALFQLPLKFGERHRYCAKDEGCLGLDAL
jgi:hypothetical protein